MAKKLFTQIVKKNGELKDVYVCVDDETAKVLEQVDEETRRIYLQEEYEIKMSDNKYKLCNQSLEKSLDNGFDVIDENQDVEAMAIKQAEKESVLDAIAKLKPQQQWIVKQVFIYGRKQCKILETLGFGNWENSRDIADLHLKKAQRENRAFGEREIIPDSFDDHEIHIEEHTKFMLSPEFDMDVKMKETIAAHVNKHREFIDAANINL